MSEVTSEQVQEAIEELHYVGDGLGSSARSDRCAKNALAYIDKLVEAVSQYVDDHDSYAQHYSAGTRQECPCDQCKDARRLIAMRGKP